MDFFNTKNLKLIKSAVDVYSRQHTAIAKNIANANSENYQRTRTDFSHELQAMEERRLRTTDSRHIAFSEVPESPGEDGEGGVDLTAEMGELADNQIRFDFSARVLRRKFMGMKASITGRTQ